MVRRVAIFLAVLWACGKPSPQEECKKLVSAGCNKAFECDKTAAMTLYRDESDCETQEQQRAGCADAGTRCTYDEAAVNACVDDVKKASCAVAQTGQQPASCAPAKVCPGEISCGTVDVTAGSSGCTYTVSGTTGPCSDGHTYGAHCITTVSCDCLRDGMATGSSFSTSSDLCQQTGAQMDAALQTGCGFGYHR